MLGIPSRQPGEILNQQAVCLWIDLNPRAGIVSGEFPGDPLDDFFAFRFGRQRQIELCAVAFKFAR